MDLNEFNCYYPNAFSGKPAKKQKTVFPFGDFTIDLLKNEQHKTN